MKSKLAGMHEDSKNVSSKKLQIETNSDNTKDNIWKYKEGIIWSVMQFQIVLFFSLPQDQLCASALPHLVIISSALSLSNFKSC